MTQLTHMETINDLIQRKALFVINHSAGKDSQAMTIELMKVIPHDQMIVVHADLPEVDWAGCEDHIRSTIGELPLIVARANKTFIEMVERRHDTLQAQGRTEVSPWPSSSTRQCTSDLKRDPIWKEIRRHVKETGHHGLIVNCMGIRAQESAQRSKKNPLKRNNRESKAGREVHEWMPIFNFTVEDVWETIKSADQQGHWAYEQGMSRLSCCFCILGSKADLRISAKHNPDLFKRMVDLEKKVGKTIFMAKKERIGLEDYIGMEVQG